MKQVYKVIWWKTASSMATVCTAIHIVTRHAGECTRSAPALGMWKMCSACGSQVPSHTEERYNRPANIHLNCAPEFI